MPSLLIELTPVQALTSVVSVLRTRVMRVDATKYACADGGASMATALTASTEAEDRLAVQASRRLNMVDVRLAGGPAGELRFDVSPAGR